MHGEAFNFYVIHGGERRVIIGCYSERMIMKNKKFRKKDNPLHVKSILNNSIFQKLILQIDNDD